MAAVSLATLLASVGAMSRYAPRYDGRSARQWSVALVDVARSVPHVVQALSALVAHGTPQARVQAVRVLSALGARGGAALPALVEATRGADAELRAAGAIALGHVDTAATQRAVLLALANDSDARVREGALEASAALRPGSHEVFALALVDMHDADAGVREAAVYASASAATLDPRAVAAMTAALADPTPDVRAAAARTRGLARAASAIPALTRAASDPDRAVRQSAVTALDARRSRSPQEAPSRQNTGAHEPRVGP